MVRWWPSRKARERRARTEALKQERSNLTTALVSLEIKRHHVEQLMQKMLAELKEDGRA